MTRIFKKGLKTVSFQHQSESFDCFTIEIRTVLCKTFFELKFVTNFYQQRRMSTKGYKLITRNDKIENRQHHLRAVKTIESRLIDVL